MIRLPGIQHFECRQRRLHGRNGETTGTNLGGDKERWVVQGNAGLSVDQHFVPFALAKFNVFDRQ
ncbi:hypothetical protein D3C85_1287110 [compost metagenome]